MARGRSSFKMGTVELIILFLLSKEDLYGYQLSTLISRLSGGNFDVNESTLYPTLYKLLNHEFISDREEKVGKRRVRVYIISRKKGCRGSAICLRIIRRSQTASRLYLRAVRYRLKGDK